MKRSIFAKARCIAFAVVIAFGSLAFAAEPAGHVKGVTAITEVFGDGQKLTAVAIEFDKAIDNSKLAKSTFAVAGRTVTALYANTSPKTSPAPMLAMGPPGGQQEPQVLQGANGNFVIIELSPIDAGASLFVQSGFQPTIMKAKVSVTQTGDISTADGATYPANGKTLSNDKVANLIVDDFQQLEFEDSKTGVTLKYNLFVPKSYDKGKSYPLVLFMHDAGVTIDVTQATLVQGLGAVIWASPSEQAKHECFVLAPQYSAQFIDDSNKETPYVDATANLLKSVMSQYSIDQKRVYTTGQSGGCMMSIALDIKYPDLFAASLLVAGQWDVTKVAPLAKDKLWIIVSAGDAKAFPGMNALTATLEKLGAKVSRDIWSGRSTAEEFKFDVGKMEAEGKAINYVQLQRGTVVPEGVKDDAGSNHVYTWKIAYAIEGVRDWLFRQSK